MRLRGTGPMESLVVRLTTRGVPARMAPDGHGVIVQTTDSAAIRMVWEDAVGAGIAVSSLGHHDAGVMQAMQEAVNFITSYREYYLSLPVVIGASGAVYGLLLAFGMLFPNSLIYLYFFIPIKAKWFVILFGLIELGKLNSYNTTLPRHLFVRYDCHMPDSVQV